MCSILTSSIGPNISQVALDAIVGVEILQVFDLGVANLGSGFDEGILGAFGCEGTFRDVDGAAIAVMLLFAAAVVGLELIKWLAIE